MNKKIFLVDLIRLQQKKFFIKWIDELKDEVIIFIDIKNTIRVFSSICPHFGGEIYYDKHIDNLRCSWHDWKFCKKTGKCLSYPIKGQLAHYNFEVNPNKLKNYDFTINNEKIYLSLITNG